MCTCTRERIQQLVTHGCYRFFKRDDIIGWKRELVISGVGGWCEETGRMLVAFGKHCEGNRKSRYGKLHYSILLVPLQGFTALQHACSFYIEGILVYNWVHKVEGFFFPDLFYAKIPTTRQKVMGHVLLFHRPVCYM